MYCARCFKQYFTEATVCELCKTELIAHSPPFEQQLELEKRYFLLDVLRKSEQEGHITHIQRDLITRPYHAELPQLESEVRAFLAPHIPESFRSAEEIQQAVTPVLSENNEDSDIPEVQRSETSDVLTPWEPPIEQWAQEVQEAQKEQVQETSVAWDEERASEAIEDVLETVESVVEKVSPHSMDMNDVDSISEQPNAMAIGLSISEETEHNPQEEYVLKESTWSAYLKPFLVQNWLYFLGTFLVLASGFYLLSLAWEGMASSVRHGVIWAGLGGTAFAFAGAGAYIHRKLGVEQAGQIFWMVGAGLLGTSAIAAGQSAQYSTPISLGLLGGSIALTLGLIRLIRPFDRGSARQLTSAGMIGQIILIGILPLLQQHESARFWVFICFYLGGLLLWQSIRQLRYQLAEQGTPSLLRTLTSLRPLRSSNVDIQPSQWDWIVFVGPVAYVFVLMLVWSGWQLSSTLQTRYALAWYGPLAVLVSAAILELLIVSQPTSSLDRENPNSDETVSPEGLETPDTPISSWVGGVVALGLLGVVVSGSHPPAHALSATLLSVVLFMIGAHWPNKALYALFGVVLLGAFNGVLRTSSYWGWTSADFLHILHGQTGAFYLPYLALLIGCILHFRKKENTHGATALRWVFVLSSLSFFSIMVYDVQHPEYTLWAAPIYALAYLCVGHLAQSKRVAYIGWLMVGFWFVYGPTQWIEATSRYTIGVLSFALFSFIVARLFERKTTLKTLRRVFDEGVLLTLPIILGLWCTYDPLFTTLTRLNAVGWISDSSWIFVYSGLVLYSLGIAWLAHRTGYRILAYIAIALGVAGAATLRFAIRSWLNLPITAWRAPLFSIGGAFVLFEISKRWIWNASPWGQRIRLFGRESKVDVDELWTAPIRQASYVLMFASLYLVFKRDLSITVQGLVAIGALIHSAQVAIRQEQKRFGYISFALFWLVGFIQLSWIDEYTKISDAWGMVFFLGGGSLLLTFFIRWAQRYTDRHPETTRWIALYSPISNVLPLFLLGTTLWFTYEAGHSLVHLEAANLPYWMHMTHWFAIALSWYFVASVLRQRSFVYLGAFSLFAAWLWGTSAGVRLLHLHVEYCILLSTLGLPFMYWISTLRLWKTQDYTIPPLFHQQIWFAWKIRTHIQGEQLWGRSHKGATKVLAFLSAFTVLFVAILQSPFLTTYDLGLLEIQPVFNFFIQLERFARPAQTGAAFFLCALPFFLESIPSTKQYAAPALRNSHLGTLFATLGSTWIVSSILTSLGLEQIDVANWVIALACSLLLLQASMWLLERWARPQHIHKYDGLLQTLLHHFTWLSLCIAALITFNFWEYPEHQGYVYLLCAWIPLCLSQLRAPNVLAFLVVSLGTLTAWTYGTFGTAWGCSLLGLNALLFIYAQFRVESQATVHTRKHAAIVWLVLAHSSIAGCFVFLLFSVLPATWLGEQGLGGVSLGFSIAAMCLQVWMLYVAQRASFEHVPGSFREQILSTDSDIEVDVETEANPWDRLWYTAHVSAWLIQLAASILFVSSLLLTEGQEGQYHALLGAALCLPWLLDLYIRPSRYSAYFSVGLGSLAIYSGLSLFWSGSTASFRTPIYALSALWIVCFEVVTRFYKQKGYDKHSGTYRKLQNVSLTLMVALIPCLIFLALNWVSEITVYGTIYAFSSTLPSSALWFTQAWANLLIPCLFIWMAYRLRSAFFTHISMLVFAFWSISTSLFMRRIFDVHFVSPMLIWGVLTCVSAYVVYILENKGNTEVETSSEDDTIERRETLQRGYGVQIAWTGIFGMLALLPLIFTNVFYIKASPAFASTIFTSLCVAGAWSWVARRKLDSSLWLFQASIASILTVHSLAAWLLPPVYGSIRYPALLAFLTAVVGVYLLHIDGRRREGRLSSSEGQDNKPHSITRVVQLLSLLSMGCLVTSLVLGASLLTRNTLPIVEYVFFFLTLGVLAWNWIRLALVYNSDILGYIGVGCFLSTYAYGRHIFGFGSNSVDAWIFLIIGFASTGFRLVWQRMGGELLQRVVLRVAFILPFLACIWMGGFPKGIGVASGIFYAVMAQQHKKKWLYIPAMIFANVEVFGFLHHIAQAAPFEHPQWYAMPFGFTLFAFTSIYKSNLSLRGRNILRNIGGLAIYASSMYQVVFAHSISNVIVLAVLAILGILAGIVLHIRNYLYLGGCFLVLNITLNLFRIGFQDRVIGMIFLFVVGILVLASAVFFNLKREQLLQQYEDWKKTLSEWE